jgi:anti-sigma regulatory factor (Ser/Thr protein kinase)
VSGAGNQADVSAHFPAEGPSAGETRRFVAATLEDWNLGHLVEVACLLVSELVANVLLHAGTDLDVRLRSAEGKVRVEVHDGSTRLPDRKYYSSTSTTGRGLLLVSKMAQTWGAEATSAGKAVWFELDAYAPEAAVPPMRAMGLPDDWEDWDDLQPNRPSARLR